MMYRPSVDSYDPVPACPPYVRTPPLRICRSWTTLLILPQDEASYWGRDGMCRHTSIAVLQPKRVSRRPGRRNQHRPAWPASVAAGCWWLDHRRCRSSQPVRPRRSSTRSPAYPAFAPRRPARSTRRRPRPWSQQASPRQARHAVDPPSSLAGPRRSRTGTCQTQPP